MTGPAPPTYDSYGSLSQRIAECNRGVIMPARMMDWNQPLQVGGSTRWHLGRQLCLWSKRLQTGIWRQTGAGTRNSGQRTLTPVLQGEEFRMWFRVWGGTAEHRLGACSALSSGCVSPSISGQKALHSWSALDSKSVPIPRKAGPAHDRPTSRTDPALAPPR